jgi:hypothetical protein
MRAFEVGEHVHKRMSLDSDDVSGLMDRLCNICVNNYYPHSIYPIL